MNQTKLQLAAELEKLRLHIWSLEDNLKLTQALSERKALEAGNAGFEAGAKAARLADCQLLRMLSTVCPKAEDEFRIAELIIDKQRLPPNPQAATQPKEVRRP